MSPEIQMTWAQEDHLNFEYLLCDLESGAWSGMPFRDVIETLAKQPEVVG